MANNVPQGFVNANPCNSLHYVSINQLSEAFHNNGYTVQNGEKLINNSVETGAMNVAVNTTAEKIQND